MTALEGNFWGLILFEIGQAMIDIHVPSVRTSGLIRLAESMLIKNEFGQSLANLGCTLKVIYDPATVNPDDMKEFSFVEMAPQKPFSGTPPLFAIRRQIHSFKGGQPWLLLDDDDYFVADSVEYLFGCCLFLRTFEERTGRLGFIGTAGVFGSNHSGDSIHISPSNAIMPKGHGLLFSSEIEMSGSLFEPFDASIGGLEEALFCSIATYYFNAIPFKRFLNPTYIKFRKEKDRETSAIHDYDTWKNNSMKIIRELSGDPSWTYPSGMGNKGTKSPKTWVKRAQLLKEEYKI